MTLRTKLYLALGLAVTVAGCLAPVVTGVGLAAFGAGWGVGRRGRAAGRIVPHVSRIPQQLNQDLVSALVNLGYRKSDARRTAALATGTTLEAKVRDSLRLLSERKAA